MEASTELLDIIKQLHIISGYRISVKDTSFNTIARYPSKNSSYCCLIQTNNEALEECIKCDNEALKKVSQTNEIYLYKCHAGLYEAVSPLYYFGTLSGFLVMGQMVTNDDDSINKMVQKGKNFINNEKELYDAAKKIPSVTTEKIAALTSIMNTCAGYITLSNRLKIYGKSPAAEAVDYINQHLTDTIRLDDICNHCFCSKTTLSSDFKRKFGVTITEYITRARMHRAAELIKDNPSLPINIVATKSGVDDANYFSKLFSAEFGISPSKFKSVEAKK